MHYSIAFIILHIAKKQTISTMIVFLSALCMLKALLHIAILDQLSL